MSSIDALELRFALDALTNQIPRTLTRDDGTTEQVWDDCLLDQLEQMGQASTRAGTGGVPPGSRPPVAFDVIALRVEMRDACQAPATAARLGAIVDSLIDSMQWEACTDWARTLRRWAATIRDMSGAERVRARPLPIDCPACHARWQYVDCDGETLRRPIMSAVFDGELMLSMHCASCGSWPRGRALDALVAFMRAA